MFRKFGDEGFKSKTVFKKSHTKNLIMNIIANTTPTLARIVITQTQTIRLPISHLTVQIRLTAQNTE